MIYCVEDERNIRELIVYTLESSGFTARGLESGKELNAAIAEQLPDLILLDIMLPGEDGLEILSRLKASEVTKEIPVIMVTAKGAEYDKVMGLDCGAAPSPVLFFPADFGSPAWPVPFFLQGVSPALSWMENGSRRTALVRYTAAGSGQAMCRTENAAGIQRQET